MAMLKKHQKTEIISCCRKYGVKPCFVCMRILPTSAFHGDPTTKDGLCTECAECRAKRMAGIRKARPGVYNAHKKKHVEENPEKAAAGWAVKNAITDGRIIRPGECEICHRECVPDGHHEDYSKPLDIVWLCRKCHSGVHAGKVTLYVVTRNIKEQDHADHS